MSEPKEKEFEDDDTELDFRESIKQSRAVKSFMQTGDFATLRDKLSSDLKNSILSLIEKESAQERARIEYITQLLDYFHLTAAHEATIKQMIQRNTRDE
jgi:hypothetical protein